MRRWVVPLSLALCLGALLCAGIQEMALYGHQGWSLARRGVAARNTLRHGLIATRFMPVESPGDTRPAQFTYYANHPALTSLLVALAVGVLGQAEWSERLVPILFTLAWFLLLFDLSRRQRGQAFAVVVAVALLAMPAVTYYGSFVNHEPIVLWAVVALLWSHARFREDGPLALPALAGAVAIGALDDWSYYFVLVPFGVLALVDGRRRRDLRAFWTLTLVGGLAFTLVAIHALSTPGETLTLFGERLEGRSTLNAGFWEVITNPLVAPRLPMLVTPFGAVAVLLTPAIAFWRWRAGRSGYLDAASVAVWTGATAYVVLLSEGLRNHDYWFFLYVPCAALGLAALIEEVRGPRLVRGLVLAPTLAWGLCALWDFRRMPSELAGEWPDHRFGENVVMRHVHRRTRPSESVLMEENVYMQHQGRYYLDRRWEWFRGQIGLGEWGLEQAASMIVLPAAMAEGPALAELGRHFRLTAFEDHWVVDLRKGPGAVDARRIVRSKASLGWRYLRSLVYRPYRVAFDEARSRELSSALWTLLGHPPAAEHDRGAWRRRGDIDARVARHNDGDRTALDGTLSRPLRTADQGAAHQEGGLLGDLLGARLEGVDGGGVEVWVAVRAKARAHEPPRLTIWVSDMPDEAADQVLVPRVPEAWWVPGRVVLYHRVIGLSRGRHALFLRRSDDGLVGPTRDVELGTVRIQDAGPLLGRY